MEVNKSEREFLFYVLSQWEAEGRLTAEKTNELKADIFIKKNLQQQIAQYFFIIALSCMLLAFGAIFLNEKILEKLKIYFSLSNLSIALIAAIIAGIWFAFILKKKHAVSNFAYEVYMLLGAMASLTSLVYVCKTFSGSTDFSLFFLLAAMLLATLGVLFLSKSLWQCGIFAVITWFGFASAVHSNHNLFLGMNYPLRFVSFGFLLLILSFLQQQLPRVLFTQRLTYTSGLLLFLISFWVVSIFGNYNYLEQWQQVRQTNELLYGLLFGVVAVVIFALGVKYKDEFTRDIAVIFLLINIYTRYFEFFWNTMNKGVFFLILAATFGVLGWWLDKNHKAKKNKSV